MAETLGSLCDKLTIVKLKQYHSTDEQRLLNLAEQNASLSNEIDQFINEAIAGNIPSSQLIFKSNKVYKNEGNTIGDFAGTIGNVFGNLADINCKLWHEQEKVYEFDLVPNEEKNIVVKKLAILNLERNKCIDEIDTNFKNMIVKRNG